jgi:hypothetical protein
MEGKIHLKYFLIEYLKSLGYLGTQALPNFKEIF